MLFPALVLNRHRQSRLVEHRVDYVEFKLVAWLTCPRLELAETCLLPIDDDSGNELLALTTMGMRAVDLSSDVPTAHITRLEAASENRVRRPRPPCALPLHLYDIKACGLLDRGRID